MTWKVTLTCTKRQTDPSYTISGVTSSDQALAVALANLAGERTGFGEIIHVEVVRA